MPRRMPALPAAACQPRDQRAGATGLERSRRGWPWSTAPRASLGDLGYTFPVVTRADLQLEAMQLSVEDRLELAAALWESLEREPAQPELPVWQRKTLNARLADDDADAGGGSPWQEVKQRILARL